MNVSDVRSLLWKYFDSWPPIDGRNSEMYSKICGICGYIFWLIRQP